MMILMRRKATMNQEVLSHPLHPLRLCRKTDPMTSFDSACATKEFSGGHRERILAFLGKFGPSGAEQIGDHVGLDAYQVRKRTAELARLGDIRVQEGVLRPTRGGRKERVWEIAS